MSRASFLVSFLFFTCLPLQAAEGAPLRIAVSGFNPPFVMQTANKQLYGFDISMMESICKNIKRSCQFEIMPFSNLLNAVQTEKTDIAINSITITPERAKLVNFSLPYLLSNSLFLGPKEMADKPFDPAILKGRSIGMSAGTIFVDIIKAMGIENAKIVEFSQLNNEIEALVNGDIDVALMDEPSARYWQIQSSNKLVVLGKPLIYGFGLGIAVNKDDLNLLDQINKGLLQYQNSEEFKQNYNRYIGYF